MSINRKNSPREQINATKAGISQANLLQFPSTEAAYYSKFNFVTYSRNNPKERAVSTGSSAEITMPLPFNLQEQYSINYSGTELGWAEQAVMLAAKMIGNPGSLMAKEVVERVKAEDLLQAMARSTFPNSNIVQQVNRQTGTIVNPHLTNVFQNVALRQHNFNWQLSPTSQMEAIALQNIVRQFREKMHPTKRGEFIIGFPDECYVTMHGSSFLYPVFKSVVQDVKIDYTDGRPNAWFTDGSPVTVSLSITLQEVETLTREDFTNNSELNPNRLGHR